MIIDFKNLKDLKNKNITFVIGTFDLLHHGHLYFLNKAEEVAPNNKLLVGIISDKITQKIKGKNRPIILQDQRAEIINALKNVDYVFIAPELQTGEIAKKVLEIVKPQYSVVTKSVWENRQKPYDPKNTKLVIIKNEINGISTSNIIKKITKGK